MKKILKDLFLELSCVIPLLLLLETYEYIDNWVISLPWSIAYIRTHPGTAQSHILLTRARVTTTY